jgi:cytochrome c556
MRQTKQALAVGFAAALLLGAVGVATSSTDVIKDRQEAMSGVGKAMGSLAAIAKGEAPFDAAVVAKNAGAIEGHLKDAGSLFPEGSGEGDVETWAKPEIWANYPDFTQKLEKSEASAAALKAVTEESAFRAALGQLGNSCKACHSDYRRPKR